MNYKYTQRTYPSSDGKNTITLHIYEPNGQPIKGVLQISHGMVDHVNRYLPLADYLTSRGFVVAGNDHLGHGMSAKDASDLGFFTDREPVGAILKDLNAANAILFDEFGYKPVMLGHSMGSFLSRLYAEKYPESLSGHIIHGTGGPMGAILPIGKAIVDIIALVKGKRYRSKFVKKMSFMGYNSKFPKEEGDNAWLTRDTDTVKDKSKDKFGGFVFTVSAYRALFDMVGNSNSKKWFSSYPKDMKTLIVSGDMDPVGNYGKGPSYVYEKLEISGVSDLELNLYEGARHELFNETNREEVFSDIYNWLIGGRV